MKKFLTTFVMMAMMAIMIPIAANAQTSSIKRVYHHHRNVINIGIGTAAGAIIGGLIKGKTGAGVGALIGAGSSALYTYKINPKNRNYYSYNRRH